MLHRTLKRIRGRRRFAIADIFSRRQVDRGSAAGFAAPYSGACPSALKREECNDLSITRRAEDGRRRNRRQMLLGAADSAKVNQPGPAAGFRSRAAKSSRQATGDAETATARCGVAGFTAQLVGSAIGYIAQQLV